MESDTPRKEKPQTVSSLHARLEELENKFEMFVLKVERFASKVKPSGLSDEEKKES